MTKFVGAPDAAQAEVPWREVLAGLLFKYRELLVFCRERDAFEAAGVFALPRAEQKVRHARARVLARKFPGALRELDAATEQGLMRRIAALERAIADEVSRERSPRWMAVVADFHAELGALLAVKRAIAAGAEVSAADRARVAEPPYGKLQELVWSALASRYGKSPDALRGIVHRGDDWD